jgi:flagellar protein FlaG
VASDTITTAMFLIAAVIAAAILLNAVFPVIYTMAGTFSQSSREADSRIRTDFKIINTYADRKKMYDKELRSKIAKFYNEVQRIWRYWLNRRS